MDVDDYQSPSIANFTQFGFSNVNPPSQLYVQRDDTLVVEGWATRLTHTLQVTARILMAPFPTGGQPGSPNPRDTPPGPGSTNTIQTVTALLQVAAANASTQALSIPLPEGYLLSVAVVEQSANAPTRGVCFCRAFISRGPTQVVGPFAARALFADYVVSNGPIGWPEGRVLAPTEGPGDLRAITVGNPAAGADWTFTIPANTRMRIQSIGMTFVTSAAAGNRCPRIMLSDGGNPYWRGVPQAVQAASLTIGIYSAPAVCTSVVSANTLNIALPNNLVMLAGQSIQSATSGLDVGDQYSQIVIEVEEWVDNGTI